MDHSRARDKITSEAIVIAENLRTIIDKQNLSIPAIAQSASIAPSTIYRLLSPGRKDGHDVTKRKRAPHGPTLEKIADAIGVDLEELTRGTHSNESMEPILIDDMSNSINHVLYSGAKRASVRATILELLNKAPTLSDGDLRIIVRLITHLGEKNST